MSDRDKPDDESQEQKKRAEEASDTDGDEAEAGTTAGSDEDEREQEASPAESEERPRPRRTGKKARAREARREAEAKAASSITMSRAGVFAVLALAAGVAAGWFGHVQQAKSKLRAESAPAASGSGAARGPCGVWEQKLCTSGGEQSALCQQAKAASDLLTPGTCEVALEAVPATLAKVKADRVPCDQLVGKLCADLPPGSGACDLVKERTPSFPGSRCKEMLGQYDQVLANLKTMDEQMAAQGAASPHGGVQRLPMPPGAPGGPGGPGGPGAAHP